MYTWSDEVNPNVETGDEMVTSVSEDKFKGVQDWRRFYIICIRRR